MISKLYQHQIEALNQTEPYSRCAYYLDMGLGKTFVGAEKMRRLGNNKNLIICQKSKINDWIEHISNFFDYKIILKLTNEKVINDFVNSQEPTVGVINYELAWRRKKLLDLKDFTLMLDESSLIQNRKAKQTKFILQLNPSNVILLSGTPSSGKYENLWTQLKLLGYKISEDMFLKQYVNFKLIKVGGVIHKTVDMSNPYKNEERLRRKLHEHGAVFMKTEEAFDLPEQNFIELKCEQTKEYKKFVVDDYVRIKDMELLGDTVLSKRLRMRQLCAQYSDYKLQTVKDIIDSTRDRVIVFYNFNDELEKLKEMCSGRHYAVVNGQEKQQAEFERYEDCILLVQYQAGAMGLNLQKGNVIIYFSLPERSELFEQSKKRIHRIGQTKPCFYYIPLTQKSIEEKIYQALKMRRDYNDELFKKDFL